MTHATHPQAHGGPLPLAAPLGPGKVLHIKAWNLFYETHDTRKIRHLSFFPKANKLVGEGIGFTLAQSDNVALLGTWVLIESIASTSSPSALRGYLVRNGTALTPERMAALTHVDANHFTRAFAHFQREEVGWLEAVDAPGTLVEENPPAGRTVRKTEPAAPPAALACIPSLAEVEAWAASHSVPVEFVRQKHARAVKRGYFAKWQEWGKPWPEMFAEIWQQDGPAWTNRENVPPDGPAGSRPVGWQEGDSLQWWTDPLATLQATLAGAAQLADKTTGVRLTEILKIRQNQPRKGLNHGLD